MKMVISALHFDWSNIEECFTKVRNEFRLDGVELSLHDRFQRPHCTKEDIATIRAVKDPFGLQLTAHIWEDLPVLGVERGREKLSVWLKVCRQTGIEGLVVHGGTYPDRKAGIEKLRQVVEGIIRSFEKHRVVLYLENHYPYHYKNCQELFNEPWEFLEVFQLIDSSALRFCFDTGHANMSRNSGALLQELAPFLSYVHLADNRGEHDDHLPYRQGTVDWEDVFSILQQIGFNHTFCFEFPVRKHLRPYWQCWQDLDTRWFHPKKGGKAGMICPFWEAEP